MNFGKRNFWRAKPLRNTDSGAYFPWLLDRGSLTAQIQGKGKFGLRLLQQRLARPTLDEASLLGISSEQQAWVREVALYCDGIPLVFAHTVLPYQPRGPLTGWLSRLGNRSLGALLFSHLAFRRGPLECTRLDPRHALFLPAIKAMQLSTTDANRLWARRSQFSFGRQSVLVTEVFSPALHHSPSRMRQYKK